MLATLYLNSRMCCLGEEFACSTVDKYMSHRTVAQAFAKYIAFTPTLHCRSLTRRHEPQESLDIYIARVVHASQVPENVPYTALYLLASMSQPCTCRLPQEDDSDDERPAPSRVTHLLSQAVTRPPFSRIAKSHWTERHIFVGAFVIALLAWALTLPDEEARAMRCWQILPEVSRLSCEEIGKISRAFDKGMCPQLRAKVDKMLQERDFRKMTEVICPFVIDRRRRMSQAAELAEKNGQKRRMSLKRSVSSFWKSSKKVTPAVNEESESGSDSDSLDFRCRSLSPNSSYYAV